MPASRRHRPRLGKNEEQISEETLKARNKKTELTKKREGIKRKQELPRPPQYNSVEGSLVRGPAGSAAPGHSRAATPFFFFFVACYDRGGPFFFLDTTPQFGSLRRPLPKPLLEITKAAMNRMKKTSCPRYATGGS